MPEVEFGEVEIGLSSLGETRYRVEVRYWPVDDDALQPAAVGEMLLDPKELVDLGPEDYGRTLAARLFQSDAVRKRFDSARDQSFAKQPRPDGLRVRLWIDPGAERLHNLRWETLYAPMRESVDESLPLAADDLVPFSRILTSWNQRRVLLRPKGQLDALVLIASPPLIEDRDTRQLVEVNIDDEWDRARAAIKVTRPIRLLARHAEAAGRPTRQALLDELKRGCDIVYIVCHGALPPEGAYLLLEDESGERDDMPGSILADALAGNFQAPPRLVVLTACQSAGSGRSTSNDAHMSLGPALIRAGAPAVLAMNGPVAQATVAEFMPTFFTELLEHGFVDRAMTAARRRVRGLKRNDWWMPVLYMRLQSGRIWSVRHLSAQDTEPYEEMSKSLVNESCVPVVGPALLEPLWGNARLVARQWAELRGFPLAPYQYDELPSVAQYVGRRKLGSFDPGIVLDSWLDTLLELLNQKWPDLGSGIDGLAAMPPKDRLPKLTSAAGARLREQPLDPYMILARLPVKIYLTATPDSLLADALSANNRPPIVEFARWKDGLLYDPPPEFNNELDKTRHPTKENPLVFHLFGKLDVLDSLVLTEDDFFDYVISVVNDPSGTVIPTSVRAAWKTNALMLLGFDLDDWTFRALYRAITSQQVPGRRRRLSAAAQLNPDEDRNLRPGAALRYLEKVFGSQSIAISWSEPQDFLREVWQRLPPAAGGPPAPAPAATPGATR